MPSLDQHSPESDTLPQSNSGSNSGSQPGSQSGTKTTPTAVDLTQPVRLVPVAIPKPWGREIWFTGMEERGESRIAQGDNQMPLSQYLALDPPQTCGAETPVLLKILDPTATSYLGDLYFEVHERKQEVYVVTHVDPNAWPSGHGAIRYGVNRALRATYANDDQFRADYLQAIKAYEHVRRQLDDQQTATREVTKQLNAQEQQLRHTMEAFTELHPLSVGDIVTVEPWFPHALQHGVRVVEFQTPTYERLIISFAQKVLTQDHWDSANAVANMSLAAPPTPRKLSSATGPQLIASFTDFKAYSVTLQAGQTYQLPAQSAYALCMNISGRLQLGDLNLEPEDTALLPQASLPCMLQNSDAGDACHFLIGGPPHLKLD